MKNPVEKAYMEAAATIIVYALAGLFVAGIWAFSFMVGWNGFVAPEFRIPAVDFMRAFDAVILLNVLIAPAYGLVQTKK